MSLERTIMETKEKVRIQTDKFLLEWHEESYARFTTPYFKKHFAIKADRLRSENLKTEVEIRRQKWEIANPEEAKSYYLTRFDD